MFEIKETIEDTITIKKSKFICKLYKIDDKIMALEIINNLKKEYKDATHYCYGYIINNDKKFNDDFEPIHSAGMPILNVLEKNCLNNTLAVVIRFFGGIKLGKGGLVRAYSKITSNAVKKAELIAIKNEKSFKIFFNIINSKKINYALKDCKIISKKFNKEIEYIIKSEKFPEDIDNLIIRKEVL